jgi:hypothetical protein
MPGVPVHLDRPPRSVRLLAWGRASHSWWGSITFRLRVLLANGQPGEIDCAAWVPATSLKRPGWASAEAVPRIDLPSDQRVWPAPPGWPSWYAGVWVSGPLALPPGVELDAAPAWDSKRRG